MVRAGSTTAEKERRLNEALAEYLEAEEAGQALDRASFVAQHPDLASDLNDFFANRSHLVAMAASPTTIHIVDPEAVPHEPTLADGPPSIRFGDYEVLSEIARGGMGVVYRAPGQREPRGCPEDDPRRTHGDRQCPPAFSPRTGGRRQLGSSQHRADL